VIRVDLSHHYDRFTTLPAAVADLTELTELNLSSNKMTSLPTLLWELTTLKQLNLSGNELSCVPAAVGRLTALTRLHLAYNRLTSLPAETGSLVALTWLSLQVNTGSGGLKEKTRIFPRSLESVPEELGKLTALKHLDLRYSGLTNMPAAWKRDGQLENSGCSIRYGGDGDAAEGYQWSASSVAKYKKRRLENAVYYRNYYRNYDNDYQAGPAFEWRGYPGESWFLNL
jgi:Leucine-rich repeat (LRR) protein